MQNIYKQKYSYDIFKKAENSVNKELDENNPLISHLLKIEQQEQNKFPKVEFNTKNKNHQYER